jgi:hypothetical protein
MVSMRSLKDVRVGKPDAYPDQSIYAQYACAVLGLTFQDIDGGTGLLFNVSSTSKAIYFGAGRASFFPQNSVTAASLATDKHFANTILAREGIPNLGGQYFFLHERHRARRPPGHERADAQRYFESLGGSAFIKPLTGSHGDFAQTVTSAADLSRYLDEVSRYYDSVLLQPIFSGKEYRIFLLDDDVVYSARKFPPRLTGDGVHSIGELLVARQAALHTHGVSSAPTDHPDELDAVLARGENRDIPGRMNRSAGGSMHLETPAAQQIAFATAGRAMKALGLRAGAVDLFTDIGGDPEAVRVIEINANPSIRFLEECDRSDLILKIWRHTFIAMGLLDV